jgi:phosphoserine phosphatase
MKRRQFVQSLTAFSAFGAIGTQVAHAASKPAALPPRAPLDLGKWAPATHKRLQAVINELGNNSPKYNPNKRPYAVFDWDNTSIMNDTEEALLMYQINHLAFSMTPEVFAQAIRQDVPAGDFKADFKNSEGKLVSLDAVANDLTADYRYLWNTYSGMKGSTSLQDVVKTEQFIDFKAKLYFLYEAINDTYGPNVGYPWVIYLFAGMTVKQVKDLAEASNDLNLGDSLRKTKYTSSASIPGQAGVVSISHTHGLRLTPEISNTMNVLRLNGFDVYVSTASLEDVVRVFATLPKYGYNVASENVIGLRLEMNGDVHQPRYRQNWPLNWGPGKPQLIRSQIVAKVGYGPALVFGDSDGDYDMLRDFPETKVGIIVNRLKKGPIGSLCKIGADQMNKSDARYALQGRDERTGQWIPEEITLKLGTTEKKLLP